MSNIHSTLYKRFIRLYEAVLTPLQKGNSLYKTQQPDAWMHSKIQFTAHKCLNKIKNEGQQIPTTILCPLSCISPWEKCKLFFIELLNIHV